MRLGLVKHIRQEVKDGYAVLLASLERKQIQEEASSLVLYVVLWRRDDRPRAIDRYLEQLALMLLRFILDSKDSGFSWCLRMKDFGMDKARSEEGWGYRRGTDRCGRA